MKRSSGALEAAWLWTYTAGMPPEEADDRRAEVRSDQWEFQRYATEQGSPRRESLRRLLAGAGDDIAWRAGFGRAGFAAARRHESILLLALAICAFVGLPASAWWAVVLAGAPGGLRIELFYIGTEAISLACTVVGGAASAAYYPKLGRALMLTGSFGIAATLWWTPLMFVVLISSVVAILCLPSREEFPAC